MLLAENRSSAERIREDGLTAGRPASNAQRPAITRVALQAGCRVDPNSGLISFLSACAYREALSLRLTDLFRHAVHRQVDVLAQHRPAARHAEGSR